MNEIKRDTNADLMNNVFEMVNLRGCYDKAEKIMDYFLPERFDVKELTNYEFDFLAVPKFGGNEGIYVDCYIEGVFDEKNDKPQRLKCGTFKTLKTSMLAMQVMGELCGSLTYFARKYVNMNLDRYTPKTEMRCSI